jgi:hypothetical protein
MCCNLAHPLDKNYLGSMEDLIQIGSANLVQPLNKNHLNLKWVLPQLFPATLFSHRIKMPCFTENSISNMLSNFTLLVDKK